MSVYYACGCDTVIFEVNILFIHLQAHKMLFLVKCVCLSSSSGWGFVRSVCVAGGGKTCEGKVLSCSLTCE